MKLLLIISLSTFLFTSCCHCPENNNVRSAAEDSLLMHAKMSSYTIKINGKVNEGTVTPEEVHSFTKLIGVNPYLKEVPVVTSFEFIYLPKGKDPVIFEHKGGNFNQAALNIMQNAKSGDAIIFRSTYGMYRNQTISLSPISIEVK